jgi:hypothetical protein
MAGANTTGDGELLVLSKTGTPLVTAGAAADDTGFQFQGYNQDG